MLNEFREFVARGNVLDLAVAVIMGGAFGAIVNSLVDDIVMPLIGVIIGGIDFTRLSINVGEAQVLYGNFLQAIVNFLVIAGALFFVMRTYNQLQKLEEEKPPPPPVVSDELKVLSEIRDLIAEKSSSGSTSSS
jgi:large conductance mechanosensitive channel